jgi:Uma2 family endonuclease
MRMEPTKKLFSVDEYYRMAEAGILTSDDRVELIDGEIIHMSPIGLRHAAVVDRAATLCILALAGRANVRVQNPIRLDSFNEPQPDISLLAPRTDFYITHHPGPEEVLLAIEIADTSLQYDRDSKIPIYASRGIRESWLVNLVEDVVLVFRDASPDRYQLSLTFHRGDSLSPLAFPDFTFTVDEILG